MEIENKYLLREEGVNYCDQLVDLVEDVVDNGVAIRQGYLPLDSGAELCDSLRLDVDFEFSEARLRDKGGTLFFTLKGNGDLSRSEIEVEVDRDLFEKYWVFTEGSRVEKVRLEVPFDRYTMEVDVYTDRDLIVAEVEVPTLEEAANLSVIGKDVTLDKKYKNKNLAR